MAYRQERSSSRSRGDSSGRMASVRGTGAGRGRGEAGSRRGEAGVRGRGEAGPRDAQAGARGRGEAGPRDAQAGTRGRGAAVGRGRGEAGPRHAESGARGHGGADSRSSFAGRSGYGNRARLEGTRADRDFTKEPKTAQGRFGKPSRGARSIGRPGREAPRVEQPEEAVNASLIVGRHPVLEALKSGRSINKVMVAQTAEGGSLPEIVGKAKALGVVVQTVPKAHLDEISAGQNHQGIAAYAAAHDYVEFDELQARSTGQAPLIVLLDEVADPYNLGAILRTAEATGVQGVVIPKRRAVPLTETVGKAAAGAMEYVPVARVSNLVQAINQLKKAGYWIVGTDVEASHDYTAVDYKGPVAIVIGAEGKGLSRLVKENCDYTVSLPMLGNLQSLNASVAAGVLLYEVVRQRK